MTVNRPWYITRSEIGLSFNQILTDFREGVQIKRDIIYERSLRCVKSLKAPFFALKRSICPDEMSSSIKGEITVTTFDRKQFVRIQNFFLFLQTRKKVHLTLKIKKLEKYLCNLYKLNWINSRNLFLIRLNLIFCFKLNAVWEI